ncbi:MAG: phenylalanine-4-hydroxylase [Flavobacteriales bacterium]|nr:phenylalanine-4-hydroxylase [Flavobacteriales bacterium]|tara:strand:- start:11017 stop:11736 length:720 start_codon:yes stop_codon:yes gene_type:complete
MRQIYSNYTNDDLTVWKLLFDRQKKNLANKASYKYNNCLKKLNLYLNADTIPNFKKLNEYFKRTTKWEIVAVRGLIPVAEFFDNISKKKFPASTWVRSKKKLDYLEEPDMFHDIFGHIPLLIDENFSNFTHKLGKLGKKYIDNEKILIQLQRIYWFTIEFGLIREEDKKCIYGSGIASSFGETNHIFKKNILIEQFNIFKIIKTKFNTSEIQEKYYMIDSYKDLEKGIIEFEKNISMIT